VVFFDILAKFTLKVYKHQQFTKKNNIVLTVLLIYYFPGVIIFMSVCRSVLE